MIAAVVAGLLCFAATLPTSPLPTSPLPTSPLPTSPLLTSPLPPVPVVGRVTDWFRQPSCSWCPGNRGLEFAAVPGRAIVAPFAGVVDFVGEVGAVPYVVVAVDLAESGLVMRGLVMSGLRETLPGDKGQLFAVFGGVLGVRVNKGDLIRGGQDLGFAGSWAYFGLRVGRRSNRVYLDPAPLFGIRPRRTILVAPGYRRSSLSVLSNQQTRHCTVSPPVVASARRPVS